MDKPVAMFDRDFEWRALTDFAQDDAPGATLGVVSGRRRQGKTFLLRALCHQLGGFYFAAEEATDGESLRRFGAALAEHTGAPAAFDFGDWRTAVDALLALGRNRPIVAVIDEFPYLARANKSLPSVIQNALAPLPPERDESRTRLLLCGSAMSFMGKLLARDGPLRGRAGLELVVPTLDHQLAAQFWSIGDPSLALRVHAIVGGTPAYRREFVRDDAPRSPDDFDPWVVRTVLNRASPLFREARYLLADEPDMKDTALYHSVLAAIASGNTTRGAIASFLGRKSGDLAHPLDVLEDAGLISTAQDAFHRRRTNFRITEPLVTFYHAVMRPIWADLEQATDPSQLWRSSQPRFATSVLGPHFEHVCRQWTRYFAADRALGGTPTEVAHGTVNDPANQTSHQLDTVAFGRTDDDRKILLAIGEAKWGETIGLPHLDRLRHVRALLEAHGIDGAATAKLMLYGQAGFTAEATTAADQSSDIVLISASDLY